MGEVADLYSQVQEKRARQFNWQWRLFVVLVAVAAMLVVNDYLTGKYSQVFQSDSLGVFVLSDKLFYWFATGFLCGVLALTMMNEGEVFSALWRVARDFERQAEETVGVRPAKRRVAKRRK